MFSCQFRGIFKNRFFYRTPPVTASASYMDDSNDITWRPQFLIIYFSCKNYFRNWPTLTFWKICISNQKVFLAKKHVLCDSSKSVSVKLVSHARAKIKTLLFPEMWVTRKICTRAAANLFFLINSIGYSLHLKNYSKSTFTAS